MAIIEASWPKDLNPRGHLYAEQAGRIAQEAGVKKLILTHISPYYYNKFEIKKLASKYFKGPIYIAKDLDSYKI